MKTPSAVLLLLWAGLVLVRAGHTDLQEKPADTTSTQLTCQPEIHTVLREMTALITEQTVELRGAKTQMETLETRLRASEKTVEEQKVELKQTEARLTARLRSSENLVQQLKSEKKALAVALKLTVRKVEELRREGEKRRVAFSVSLLTSGSGTRNTGPFSKATPLVYRHVFTNTGNAYNPNTGVFTAPVRGVYHFVLHLLGQGHGSRPTAVSLHKNGEPIILAFSLQTSGYDSPSNGASLLLEVGDVVYVKLWPNSWVRDNSNHHTTFSGHLLFPM